MKKNNPLIRLTKYNIIKKQSHYQKLLKIKNKILHK